jgi:type II secretory pathway pseudopilin PulG
MKRSSAWLVAGLFGLLFATLAFSAMRYREAQDRAERASVQAQQVQDLAYEIRSLTDRPSVATTQSDEVQQLSGLIESSAAECGIDQQQIDRIDAQAMRRVGKSPYYRLPTRVNLLNVEMPLLVDLLEQLTQGDRIRIDDCRLFAPHGEVVGKHWNAEFTLSYLIYDPQQDASTR